MKKLLLLFLAVILSITLVCKAYAEDISPSKNELAFAMKYFSILYSYDTHAATFAQESLLVSKEEQLKNLFLQQDEFVNDTLSALKLLTPPVKFQSSYKSVTKGLEVQSDYLKTITKEMQAGTPFDEAFTINNWGFITAQKNIQEGINDFKLILESYSESNQLQVIAATGITEEELTHDAQQCEYIRKIQESIK